MSEGEVHEAARDVLHFWFEETPAKQWFEKSGAFDDAIRERFGALRDRLEADGAAGWDGSPETALAAVIVLDQFSRNLFRGDARAFAADPVARDLSRFVLNKGWDKELTKDQRAFLYLPLEHSELPADQDESVAAFASLGDAEYSKFAEAHRAVIARFGRFPGRNKALGRESTPEEREYLAQPGTDW